jgi:DNA polymerase I-like protein with 3'-5' exonuclease and polymerase domains
VVRRWDKALYEHGIDRPKVLAVDTETTGLGYYDEPFAATVTWRGVNDRLVSHYFPLAERWNHPMPDATFAESKIALTKILTRTPTWVGHNLKFDLQKMRLAGIVDVLRTDRPIQAELHDTQTIYQLLDENSTKRLKDLAVRVLKYDDTIDVPYKSGAKKGQTRPVSREKYELDTARRKMKLTKDDGYHPLPRRIVVPYALRDTEFTLRLYETLMPQLRAKGDPELLRLYDDSMRLKLVLLDMEADGFGLDEEYLTPTTSEYGVKEMKAWGTVVRLVGNPEFNPGSPKQLTEAFAKRGVHLADTQADTLKALDDDLARAILAYRDAKKIHTTYLRGLQREQRDGIVHPNFNDDGPSTGRMSSSTAKE